MPPNYILYLAMYPFQHESTRRLRSPKQLVNCYENHNPNSFEEEELSSDNLVVQSKVFTPKLQFYFKAVECLQDIDSNLYESQNVINTINSTIFWYRVSAEYFYFDYVPKNKKSQARQQIIKDFREKYMAIQLNNNLDRKKSNSKTDANNIILPFQTLQIKSKSQKVSLFLQYTINQQWNYFRKVEPVRINQLQTETTTFQDLRFISSIRTTLFNIVKSNIRNKASYKVVKVYLQAVNLNSTKIDCRYSKNPYRDLLSSQVEGQIGVSSEQSKIEQSFNEDRQQMQLTADHILLSVIMNLQIQILIRLLENNLPQYSFPDIDSDNDSFLYDDLADTVNFVATSPRQQKQIICNLRQKLKKDTKIQQQENNPSLCQVCFSQIYSVANPKVRCCYCNISVHMKCILLQKVPEQQCWMCEVCQYFGGAGVNLGCALCTEKGGVMKRCTTNVKSYKCQQFNSIYSQYLKTHNLNTMAAHRDQNRSQLQKKTGSFAYDYFDSSTYSTEQPFLSHLWAHYTCISFIDQCVLVKKKGSIVCEGIQRIPRHRFSIKCQICVSNSGVAVKCAEAGCDRRFHAECAARKLLIIEDASQTRSYLSLYCATHKPLAFERTLMSRHKNYRQQIQAYANSIIQNVGQSVFLKRMCKSSETKQLESYFDEESSNVKPQKKASRKQMRSRAVSSVCEEHQVQEKEEKQDIYYGQSAFNYSNQEQLREETPNRIKKLILDQNNTTVLKKLDFDHKVKKTKKTKMKHNFDKLLLLSKHKKEVIQLEARIKRINNRKLEKSQIKNMTSKAKPIKVCQNGEEDIKSVEAKAEADKIMASIVKSVKNQILYCLCQKPYEQKYPMLQCEKCNQWFHFGCIGYIGTIKVAKKLKFICVMCLKMQTKITRSKIIKSYMNLFKKQSKMFMENRDAFLSLQKKHSKVKSQSIQYQQRNQQEEDLQEERSRSRNRK